RALEREPKRDHLDLVSSANALRLLPNRLPLGDPVQHGGDMTVIGEVVESALRRALDRDLRGELRLPHFDNIVSMRWQDGRVSTEDSVAMPTAISGNTLRDAYWTDIRKLTFGLVRTRDNSLFLGPVELMRFGLPAVTRTGVTWPIRAD